MQPMACFFLPNSVHNIGQANLISTSHSSVKTKKLKHLERELNDVIPVDLYEPGAVIVVVVHVGVVRRVDFARLGRHSAPATWSERESGRNF